MLYKEPTRCNFCSNVY